jgi:hypothetical protein
VVVLWFTDCARLTFTVHKRVGCHVMVHKVVVPKIFSGATVEKKNFRSPLIALIVIDEYEGHKWKCIYIIFISHQI